MSVVSVYYCIEHKTAGMGSKCCNKAEETGWAESNDPAWPKSLDTEPAKTT